MARTGAWLLSAVALGYAQALFGPLQFDDYATLAVDPAARSLGAWWTDLAAHVRPLTKLSFVATHGLGRALGDVALGHHLGSVLIHAGAVLALHALAGELLRSCVPQLPARQRASAAFAAALLFAVHPIATEAVTYLSGRSMALGSLCAFLGLLAWMRGRRGLAALALLAAVLARETMALAVLLVLLWQWARWDERTAAFSAARLRALPPLLLAAVPALALVAAWLLASPRYAGLLDLASRIAADRATAPTLLAALGYFCESLLLLRYPNIDPDVTVQLAAPVRAVATAVVAAALLLAWRMRSRRPEWLLGMLWVLACIAPLYLVHARHDWIAERHFYPALAGAAILVGASLARLARGGTVLLVAAALACGTITLVRNADYRSEVALWEATARHSPGKVRVLNNLGAAYLEAGRWQEAESVLQEAVAIDPGHARAAENLRQARERRLASPRRF
jgi:tetratricopeptide (TPR) repeat protein